MRKLKNHLEELEIKNGIADVIIRKQYLIEIID